jgi:hypothetical protein
MDVIDRKPDSIKPFGLNNCDLNDSEFELLWISGLKDQIDFANENLRHYTILFRVSPRNWSLDNSSGGAG